MHRQKPNAGQMGAPATDCESAKACAKFGALLVLVLQILEEKEPFSFKHSVSRTVLQVKSSICQG